jgi:pimeloyl-ACP methyl ester carboxylesterase
MALCLIAATAACQPAARGAPDYSRTPIVFVHGSGLNSRTWAPLRRHLQQEGYPPEFLHAVDIEPNDASNVWAAEHVIAPAVAALLASAETAARRAGTAGTPHRVDLVTHSMGAVSSRWYARQHAEKVRRVITLAGSNHGTDALCAFPSPGNDEMCPAFATEPAESLVQLELNGTADAPVDETPFGIGTDRPRAQSVSPDALRRITYFTIRIEPDEWIRPEHSAMLDGAGGIDASVPSGIQVAETTPGNFLFQHRTGHDHLPQHPALMELVSTLLRATPADSGAAAR